MALAVGVCLYHPRSTVIGFLGSVIIPDIAMQFPRTALLQKKEDLLATVFDGPSMVTDFRIRNLRHGPVVTVELVIAERYGVGLCPGILLGEVCGNRAATRHPVAAGRQQCASWVSSDSTPTTSTALLPDSAPVAGRETWTSSCGVSGTGAGGGRVDHRARRGAQR